MSIYCVAKIKIGIVYTIIIKINTTQSDIFSGKDNLFIPISPAINV